jgi:hypothetical protein
MRGEEDKVRERMKILKVDRQDKKFILIILGIFVVLLLIAWGISFGFDSAYSAVCQGAGYNSHYFKELPPYGNRDCGTWVYDWLVCYNDTYSQQFYLGSGQVFCNDGPMISLWPALIVAVIAVFIASILIAILIPYGEPEKTSIGKVLK